MGEVQVQGSFGRDCPSEEGRQGMRDAEDDPHRTQSLRYIHLELGHLPGRFQRIDELARNLHRLGLGGHPQPAELVIE